MRFFLFVLLFACEDSKPEIPGEQNILTFSSNVQNNHNVYWTPEHPVVTHAHFNLNVRGWHVEHQKYDTPEDKDKAFEPFKERYQLQDTEAISNKMARENFTFNSPLQITATETTQASKKHRGAVEVIATKAGRYSIEAQGTDNDSITVEFADPSTWGLAEARISFLEDYLQTKSHQKLCIYGTGEVKFLYELYDSQQRLLFGEIPQVNLSTETTAIDIRSEGNAMFIQVKEAFEPSTIKLVAQNVFGDDLYPELPAIELCHADDSYITGVYASGWLSETIETEFEDLKENDRTNTLQILKKTKRGSTYRNFLKESINNNGQAFVTLIPEINSTVPTFNTPVQITVNDGLVITVEGYLEAMNLSDIEAIEFFLKHSSSSITVTTGTPILIVYPHNNEHKVSLTAVGHQENIVIPHKPPPVPEQPSTAPIQKKSVDP